VPITYTSDAAGLRVTRERGANTTRLTWDTSADLPLLLRGGDTSYVYDDDGLPVEQVDGSGEVAYYHHDHLGSTRMLTDSTGHVLGTFTYDAAGKVAGATGTATPALAYAGQYTDPDSGLVYMRARDYDPATGEAILGVPRDGASYFKDRSS
jgi:uncharacterized protein RhaS with RHS repeats